MAADIVGLPTPLAAACCVYGRPEAAKELARKQAMPDMYLSLLYQLQGQVKAPDKAVASEGLRPALHAVALYLLKDSNPARAFAWDLSPGHSEVNPPSGCGWVG